MKTNFSLVFGSVLLACALTACGASGSEAASSSSEAAVSSSAASAAVSETAPSETTPSEAEAAAVELADGDYACSVTLEGGSGKATVESPAKVTVKDGAATATIVWSSKNYDYMLVDGEKYLPVNTEGNSTFEIPLAYFDAPLDVVGDTVAMSTPHEVEYTLTFDSSTLKAAE